jgi:hypothetical protein
MSGRPDKTSRTYIRRNRRLGKAYAVTLRNPRTYEKQGASEIAVQNRFHAHVKGVNAFYRRIRSDDADPEDHALFERLVRTLDRQQLYATVRGYLMAKCSHVSDDLTKVVITVGDHVEEIPVTFTPRPLNIEH